MKQYLPVLSIVLVVGLTLLSGIIHGRMSDRWGPPQDSLAAANKLAEIPDQFGGWKLQISEEISDSVVEMLECAGYINRTYVNQETGESVNVAILLGPPGPISVHTPEICYSSRDYAIVGEPQQVTVRSSQGSDDEFWAMTFQSRDLSADILRVYYAWSTGGGWSAAKAPRFTFAACPYLYKIQLAGHLPPGADAEASDPCRSFLQNFVPVATRYLVEPAGD